MPTTAQTVFVNGMVENRRYDAMLRASVPAPPGEPSEPTAPDEVPTSPDEEALHRDAITLSDVMGHPLVQPFRHSTSLTSRRGIPLIFLRASSLEHSSTC
jgi:hypothetical protein